ncbi:hypothetical protein [Pseudomonas azotoformans]|uniref:hypothetical protein n=1 Tax=Pseudomonas azotoformans TaxID=47878 RepID=UPI00098F7928|nr:hypothetical protein [Pseudomonas azotoformans]AQT97168.1 hypothetical protein B1R45_29225 [Pseudomonas azotoformans]UMY49292.1 hypothetical protein MLC69_29110 [Pseudomonas azotoformans]
MKRAQDYLEKTESAVRYLFNAVETYLEPLRAGSKPTFVSGLTGGPEQDAQFSAWLLKNADALEEAKAARMIFRAESFALDTVCGAILQIAEKGLEIYSSNNQVPKAWQGEISVNLAKFCVGREVRRTPLGLIIYAARNQHTHFNEEKLHKASANIFNNLASQHGFNSTALDPAFNLENPSLTSYASNVTALMGWRSFEKYEEDMRAMLQLD